MNMKIAFELAAFVHLGLANAADSRSHPVGANPPGDVIAAPSPDRRGRENVPPALDDDAARAVLRAEVEHLGVAFQATLRGDRDDSPPPALDDAERGAAEPTSARGNSSSEQDCIIGNIDFGNSTVGALMTRGFPLFTDFGLDMGRISDAYFELEPMYEINMTNWKEYTAGNSSWQVWRKEERGSYGGGAGYPFDQESFMHLIGFKGVMKDIPAFSGLVDRAFEKLYGPTRECSLNSYCREAADFARSVGADPPKVGWTVTNYRGPLDMFTPFVTDFLYTDPDGIGIKITGVKFTEGYLEALEALPEVYDREAYLAFCQRFGLAGSVTFFQFSNTDVFVAGEEYITMGSKNYEGQECANPKPSLVLYSKPNLLLDKLSSIQKARFETLNGNLLDMVENLTLLPSHTASPTSSLAPSLAPTNGSQTRKHSALLAVFALLCNLIM